MREQPPQSLTINTTPIDDIETLGAEWRALEQRSRDHSFFLSWHWIGVWLHSLPKHITPIALRIYDRDGLAGLAILYSGKSPVLRFAQLDQLALNETGDPSLDSITIEYNGFLAASGMGDSVAGAALAWLAQGQYGGNILQLGGIDPHLSQLAAKTAKLVRRDFHLIRHAPAPFVDLAAVRASGKDYLMHLSPNTRQALRRSMRYFEATGPLQYQKAQSTEEALSFFNELELLHQSYWNSLGKPGAFARPFFKQFHTRLIHDAFPAGHIEIARISAGDKAIGYLYNFIWQKTVYAYQSGFARNADTLARPGYVSHYLAIIKALGEGLNVYDFMAGERQHKTSLSTQQKSLDWIQIRPRVFLIKLEQGVRKIVTAIRHIQKPAR